MKIDVDKQCPDNSSSQRQGLNKSAVVCFLPFRCLSRAPLKHTAQEGSTLSNSTNQRCGIVVLDAKHIVHHDGTKDIEADVSPADSEIAPAFAVDYRIQLVESRSNQRIFSILTNIASCQILIGI